MTFGNVRVFRPAAALVMSMALILCLAWPVEARPRFSSIVVDARTGAILSSDDADGLRHPASLTKMMTLYILFQDLKAGRIKLSTPLRVSPRAAAMAPSKLGLKAGSTITVEQAIKALVIKSANDAAAAVGENLAGSEAAFAKRMTRVAHAMGMRRTNFRNASGLPHPAQVTTARDMATLGLRLMRDFPQYYPYFRSTSFVYKGRVIRSHNRLVGRFAGTDGIKTGYINASGFNLVTSTRRDGKRVVGVVIGARSSASRNAHMMTIISRALPKGRSGNTIAALAGSSKGAINPLTNGTQNDVPQFAADDMDVLPDQDKTLMAAAAAKAAEDTTDEDAAEAAVDTPADAPQVIEAKIEAPLPKSLPFAVKPAGRKGEDLAEGFSVQISSYRSKADAQTGLSNMRAAVGSAMKGKDSYTIAVRKAGKVTYRVVIAGMTEHDARQSCAKASKMGKSCTVLTPQG